MSITALEWNAFLREVKASRVLDVLSLDHGRQWRHPWYTTADWDPRRKRWLARIKPGFVNGLDVTASIDDKDVPLTDSPGLPLMAWRAIGSDAEPVSSSVSDGGALSVSFEAVPEFFKVRGVGEPPTIASDGTDGLVINENTNPTTEQRRLRACDLVLYHDRPALASQVITGIGFDASQINVALSYRSTSSTRRAAYVRAMSRYKAAVTASPLEQLVGLYQQPTFDAIHLATVYALSPNSRSEEIDESWSIYTAHKEFWNLRYAHSLQGQPLDTTPLRLSTGLAAGLLDSIGNAMLAPVNDANAAALALLNNRAVAGEFWSV